MTDAVRSGRTAFSLDKTPLQAMTEHARSLECDIRECVELLTWLGNAYKDIPNEVFVQYRALLARLIDKGKEVL